MINSNNNYLLPSATFVLFFILFTFSKQSSAAELTIAVASNFANTAEALVDDFERRFSHTVSLSRGSSGKHYAQIKNGAPFDIFLAADISWPTRLEKEGLVKAGTRLTYAIGKLVLWSAHQSYSGTGDEVIKQNDYRNIAIANPRLAPYGFATQEVLNNLDLIKHVEGKMVMGENINQTFLFVHSGNADLGFIAATQLKRFDDKADGYYWHVPESLYTSLEQQAIVIKTSEASSDFMQFLSSEEARAIIQDHGYGLPHAQ